jgi:homoserine O-acetyltransferase
MDRFDLAKHGGTNVAALKNSRVEHALVIGVESDMLFAIAEQRALAEDFKNAGVSTRFAPLDCIEGHDSFLIDIERFGKEMRSLLDTYAADDVARACKSPGNSGGSGQ